MEEKQLCVRVESTHTPHTHTEDTHLDRQTHSQSDIQYIEPTHREHVVFIPHTHMTDKTHKTHTTHTHKTLHRRSYKTLHNALPAYKFKDARCHWPR